jgi:hypothetical protein
MTFTHTTVLFGEVFRIHLTLTRRSPQGHKGAIVWFTKQLIIVLHSPGDVMVPSNLIAVPRKPSVYMPPYIVANKRSSERKCSDLPDPLT